MPFWTFVWIVLVSIGLEKVIVRSNEPEVISRKSQVCPCRWRPVLPRWGCWACGWLCWCDGSPYL